MRYAYSVGIDNTLAIPPGAQRPDFRRVMALTEVSVDRKHDIPRLPPGSTTL